MSVVVVLVVYDVVGGFGGVGVDVIGEVVGEEVFGYQCVLGFCLDVGLVVVGLD